MQTHNTTNDVRAQLVGIQAAVREARVTADALEQDVSDLGNELMDAEHATAVAGHEAANEMDNALLDYLEVAYPRREQDSTAT